MSEAPRPLSLVEKTLLREAASEGEEGMYRAYSTMVQRARRRKLSLEEVVNQPFQYSGRWSPDLDTFASQQPPATVAQMRRAMSRGDLNPYPATHYLTLQLLNSRHAPSWVKKLQRVGSYGNHMFFLEE